MTLNDLERRKDRSHRTRAISAVAELFTFVLGIFSVGQQCLVNLESGYLVNDGQAVDDAKHNDRIAMRVVSYLNCHCVQQHLIQSISEQRLRHLAEEVL